MIKFSQAFLKQLWLTMGASLSFLIIGLVRGYSSTAIPSIEEYDSYLLRTTEQKSWIGAIPPLGAFFGSLMSGLLMQRAGRRRALMLAAPLWAASWLLIGFAINLPMLLVGRISSGFCVGLVLATAQVYVSECSNAEIRGMLGSLPTICMSGGILASYVMGYWLYWRYLAFVAAAICGFLFLTLLPLPESPVWLKAHGQDASPANTWLHLAANKTNVTEKPSETEEPSQRLFTRKVFFSNSVFKPFIICFMLLVLQQISGIDAVIFFTVEIFKSAGSSLDATTAAIIVGAVQMVSNGVSTALVDRAGRRPLLLISVAIVAASTASMGAAFYLEYERENWIGYLPVVSLVVFMVGFSLGLGGLPFLLLGELLPARHREQLSALAGSANLLTMFAVIKSYHPLQEVLTSAGTFWLYSCCCVFGFALVAVLVPETRGKTLMEIEHHFCTGNKKKPETGPLDDAIRL